MNTTGTTHKHELMQKRLSAKECAPAFQFHEALEELKNTNAHAWTGQKEIIEQLRSALQINSRRFNIAIIGNEGIGRTKTLRSVLEEFKDLKGEKLEDLIAFYNPKNPMQASCIWVSQGYGRKIKNALEELVLTLKQDMLLIQEKADNDERTSKTWKEFRKEFEIFSWEYEKRTYDTEEKLHLIFRQKPQPMPGQPMDNDETEYTPEIHGSFDFRTMKEKKQVRDPIGFSIGRQITCKDGKERYIFTDQLDKYLSADLIDGDTAEAIFESIVPLGKWQQERGDKLEHERNTAIEEIKTFYKNEVIKKAFSIFEDIVCPKNEMLYTHPDFNFEELIKDMREMVIKNINLFMPPPAMATQAPQYAQARAVPSQALLEEQEDFTQKFTVHILVDNTDAKEVPVIFEKNGDWKNIIGSISRKNKRGMYVSDHMDIQAGSLLQAHGGFWVIDIQDIISALITSANAPTLFEVLRAAKEEKLEIKNWDPFGLTSTQFSTGSIPFNTKCILLLTLRDYVTLSEIPAFKSSFKERVEFESSTLLNKESFIQFCLFMNKVQDDEGLKTIHPSAVEELTKYATRLARDKNKISLAFGTIADIIRNASNAAESPSIMDKDIRAAIQKKNSSIIRKEMIEYRLNDIVAIHTSGERIGELTALAVIRVGEAAFGMTTRAATNVSRGNGSMNVTNIESIAKMAGHTCEKSFEIVKSALKTHFDIKKNFDAEFVFEQNYDFVDGDSASLLMYCVLISALSNIPLKQNYAITGRISLRGEVGPIGGVNEKIEGWFDLCMKKGFTETQGVIIPKANMLDLNLRQDIVEAIENEQFHIFAVGTVTEALEILTGRKAGIKTSKKMAGITFEEQVWEPGSIYEAVEKRLKSFEKKNGVIS